MFELTKRQELLCTISDLHKEARGFRPSLDRYELKTDDELMAEIEWLGREVKEEIEREQQIDALCITRFNDEVAIFIQQGAANRSTAIRWMLQAQGYDETPADADFICYNNGINPFIPEGKAIFEEVEAAIIS
ncbi:MAG: hypothetical protein ACO4CS_20535 [bacterium]